MLVLLVESLEGAHCTILRYRGAMTVGNSPEEIARWRAERRKHYPTRAKVWGVLAHGALVQPFDAWRLAERRTERAGGWDGEETTDRRAWFCCSKPSCGHANDGSQR